MCVTKREVHTAMKIKGFRYFIKEAFKNIFSNGWMTIASIFTVMASLLILGVFLVLSINLNSVIGDLQGSYELIAVVDEKTTTDGLMEIRNDILRIANVEDTLLENKNDRLEELKTSFGENSALLDRYKDDNPLRDWYKVTLSDLNQSKETAAELEKVDGIVKVIRNQDTIDNLVRIANYIKQFSLWIILALAVVSIFIISNTIKLTVYTRRKEINIMKFVGATDWFIRWPFIIEGILIGLVGSLASVALILGCYQFLLSIVQSLSIVFVQLKPFVEILPIVLISSFGLGAALGGLGSFLSVRKHLNV